MFPKIDFKVTFHYLLKYSYGSIHRELNVVSYFLYSVFRYISKLLKIIQFRSQQHFFVLFVCFTICHRQSHRLNSCVFIHWFVGRPCSSPPKEVQWAFSFVCLSFSYMENIEHFFSKYCPRSAIHFLGKWDSITEKVNPFCGFIRLFVC